MRGFVKKIATKEGQSKRGKWTRFSFITEGVDGTESGWITYGFDQPPFTEGDFIEFDTEENNGFKQVKKGSATVVSNPPPRAGAKSSAAQAGPSPHSVPGSSGPEHAGRVAGETGPDRQTQITLQHSQEMAIQTVAVLLEHNALPKTEAQTKTGTAKRFDEIVAAIDKLTVKYHNDVATGRLLYAVADMGVVSVAADAPLPDPGKTPTTTTNTSEDDV